MRYLEYDCHGEHIKSRCFFGRSLAQCMDRAALFVARLELAGEGTAFRTLTTRWDPADGDAWELVVYWDSRDVPSDFKTEPFNVND